MIQPCVHYRTLFRTIFSPLEKINGTIVVVDDDKDVLLSARLYLQQYFASVIVLNKPTDLLPLATQHRADVVLLDMNYHRGSNDGREGLHWLRQLREHTDCEVVMMTAYGEVELAVEAIKAGAADFVVKPWSNEKLLATMMSTMQLSKSKKELNTLKRQQEAWNSTDAGPALIGESEAIKAVQTTVLQVAPTDANVLVLGENGTGKEIVARLLHHHSGRRKKPFVKVDLGAVHEGLFESELFGAKKGAYTDLKQDKAGRFELAHRGTLFLDEIGNLSPGMQAKLLSVLQNHRITPLGSNHEMEIDVRLVCATNADLHHMVENKTFRQDLLYRINTIEITVPPLRERTEDIPLLARHFIGMYSHKYRKPGIQLNSSAIRPLQKYPWPGNVRELQHAIERAVIMNRGGSLAADEIIPRNVSNTSRTALPVKLDELERQHIARVIEKNEGNISQAAKDLGLTRAALYRRMEKYRL